MNEKNGKLPCDVCKNNIPQSVAGTPEGAAYVREFCETDCCDYWNEPGRLDNSSRFSHVCPVCGNTGHKVSALTLDNHIKNHLRTGLGDKAAFCLNPGCDVVYYNSTGGIIRRGQTRLPVTIKDPSDYVYVCYCFEFTRGDILRDLKANGKTDIPGIIKKRMKDNRCDCERRNPQGKCCLGNVAGVIKDIEGKSKNQGGVNI